MSGEGLLVEARGLDGALDNARDGSVGKAAGADAAVSIDGRDLGLGQPDI